MTIPGLFNGRDKAFFFVNWGSGRCRRSTVARDRTILHPSAQAGNFLYNTAGGVRSVNLLALAAANGQTSTFDPIISSLLADIRSATGTTGTITDLAEPILQRVFVPSVPVDSTGAVANRPRGLQPDEATTGCRASPITTRSRRHPIPSTTATRVFRGFPATGDPDVASACCSAARCGPRSGRAWSTKCAWATAGAPGYLFKELATGMWGGGGGGQPGRVAAATSPAR